MARLKIIPNKRTISGNVGAVRVNPNIADPLFKADAAFGRATGNVGKAAKRISRDIQKAEEEKDKRIQKRDAAMQKAEDFTIKHTALREMRLAFKDKEAEITDDNTSTSVQLFSKLDAFREQQRQQLTSDPDLSEEGRLELTVRGDDEIGIANLKLESIIRSKIQERGMDEYNTTRTALVKSGNVADGLALAQSAHDVGLFDLEDLRKEQAQIPYDIRVNTLMEKTLIAPNEVEQFIAEDPTLEEADKNIARNLSRDTFGLRKDEAVTDFMAKLATEIGSAAEGRPFDKERMSGLLDSMEQNDYFDAEQVVNMRNRLSQEDVNATSNLNQRALNTIRYKMRNDFTYTRTGALGDLAKLRGDLTNKDFAQFISTIDEVFARKDQITETEKHLYKKLEGMRDRFQRRIAVSKRSSTTPLALKFAEIEGETRKAEREAERIKDPGEREDRMREISFADFRKKSEAERADPRKQLETVLLEEVDNYLKNNPHAKIEDADAWFNNLLLPIGNTDVLDAATETTEITRLKNIERQKKAQEEADKLAEEERQRQIKELRDAEKAAEKNITSPLLRDF